MLVYVADDQEDTRGYLVTVLELLEYKVVEFPNGQELVKELEIEKPAVVITDIDMPILNGFGVIDASKKAEVPVLIATSGDPEYETKVEATSALFMPKPLTIGIIKQKLAEGLRQAGYVN